LLRLKKKVKALKKFQEPKLLSETGLITITGGKWTTHRKIAEDIIDKAPFVICLKENVKQKISIQWKY
jgi:glycerol-3-phosphate dehydrogenase